jgi:hypothetical protein
MNQAIGVAFRNIFETLLWHERTAGIVTVATKLVDGKIKRFPVYRESPPLPCDVQDSLYDLVPNDTYRSIIYCEDRGTKVDTSTDRRIPHVAHNYISSIRVVCWYNSLRIDGNEYEIVWDLMKRLENAAPISPIVRMEVHFVGQPAKTSEIFGRYTYDEVETQYLMHPYNYFALDYEVYYALNLRDCVDPVNIEAEICYP